MDIHQVSNNGPPKPTIKHFSHPHMLNLVNKPQPHYDHHHHHHHNQNPMMNMILCSGCNLSAATSPSGSPWVYSCAPCGFFLHVSCSRMPQQITHPCCGPQHPGSHVLKLHPKPDAARLPSGKFTCAACLKPDDCFAYHCKPCGLDLHPSCAVAPLLLPANRGPHRHPHPLRLLFSLPYPQRSFSCAAAAACHVSSGKGWLYRCDACDFDLHFGCARAQPRPAPAQQQQPRQHDDQGVVNQRFAQFVMQNHPQMAGMGLRPPGGGPTAAGFLRPQGNNYGGGVAGLINQQVAAQQQAMMRVMMANYNAGCANTQNLAAQMIRQRMMGGGGGANGGGNAGVLGFDPTGGGGGANMGDFGVDPTGGGANMGGFGVDPTGGGGGAGGFDPAAMSGLNCGFGAVGGGGGVDFGALMGGGGGGGGGVDFGQLMGGGGGGGGVDFGALMGGGGGGGGVDFGALMGGGGGGGVDFGALMGGGGFDLSTLGGLGLS